MFSILVIDSSCKLSNDNLARIRLSIFISTILIRNHVYSGYPYRRKMVTVAKNLGNWKWKIRTDLDVFQRCLTVALIAHLAYAVMNAVSIKNIISRWVS